MNSLKPKLLYQLAVSFFFSAAPIIIFPYVSRVLGPEHIGRINFIDYASQFFILLASFGIPFYGVREAARLRKDKEQLSQLASELVIIHVLASLLSLLLFAVLIFLRRGDFNENGLLLLAIISISGSALGFEWLIHGLEEFSFLARRSLVVKLLTLAAVFMFVRTGSDFVLYYTILIAGNLLLQVIDLAYVLRKGIRLRITFRLKRHWRPLFIFSLTALTLSIYNFFDTVILGLIAGSLAVGFYTTALKIIRLAHNFISDLGGVLLPRMSFLIESGEHEEVGRLINKSLDYVLTITLPLGFFFFLAAPEIILVLGGGDFLPSVPVLQLLSVLPVIIGLTNLFFIQVLLPFGREKIMLGGVLAGSVISIGANLWLCPILGEQGAAISCVAAETGVAIFLGYHALKEVRLKLRVTYFIGILASALVLLPSMWLGRLCSNSPLVVLVIAAMAGFGSLLLLQMFVFKNHIVREMVAFFWKRSIR